MKRSNQLLQKQAMLDSDDQNPQTNPQTKAIQADNSGVRRLTSKRGQRVFVRLVDARKTIVVDSSMTQSFESLRQHIKQVHQIVLAPDCYVSQSRNSGVDPSSGEPLISETIVYVSSRPGLLGGSSGDYDSNYKRESSPNDELVTEKKKNTNAELNPKVVRMSKLMKEAANSAKSALKTVATKKEVKAKCKKAQIFLAAVGDDSDEWDEWDEIFDTHIDQQCEIKNLDDCAFEPKYNKKDLDAEMNFINDLENRHKHHIIDLIEHEMEVTNSKQPFTKNPATKQTMKEFLSSWRPQSANYKRISMQRTSTLMYPRDSYADNGLETSTSIMYSGFGGQKQQRGSIELEGVRRLELADAKDKWFVKTVGKIPRIIYDYYMMEQNLSQSTCLRLELEAYISTSVETKKLRHSMRGDIFELLIHIKYEAKDCGQIEKKEINDDINKRIMALFESDTGAKKKTEKPLGQVMHDLTKIPEFMQLLADRIINGDFLDVKYTALSIQMADPEKYQLMVQIMSNFDKLTQQTFFKRLRDKMQQKDQVTQDDCQFHPELLVLKEMEMIKEVPVDEQAIALSNSCQIMSLRRTTRQSLTGERCAGEGPFWISNFPLLSFIGKPSSKNSSKLFIAHLSDLESPYMTFELKPEEEFISFIEKFVQSKDASISMLLKVTKSEEDVKLIFRTYSYPNPFEKRKFTKKTNWIILRDEEFESSEEIQKQLDKMKKISLVQRETEEGEHFKGLLIQTDESIWFYNVKHADEFEKLISDEFTVKLQMIRGLRDKFYFALRDDGAASDSIQVLDFEIKDGKLVANNESIPAAYTGEILALELDPLNTNDVESYYHDDETDDLWHDKFDRIYVIDGRLNLFQFSLERECRMLKQINLTQFKNVQTIIETEVRDKEFMRIGITDRCLTIKGRTYNHQTGYEWDFFYNSTSKKQEIIFSESLPISCLQIALLKNSEKVDGQESDRFSFLIKNDPSSRRRVLFDHRSDDVLLFTMLNKNLILAKIKGNPLQELHDGASDSDNSDKVNKLSRESSDSLDDFEGAKSKNTYDPYWSLMDTEGKIYPIPKKMCKLLKRRDWNSFSVKQDYQSNTILIVLKNYKEVPIDQKKMSLIVSKEQSLNRSKHQTHTKDERLHIKKFNPFPDISAIIVDAEVNQVYCETFVHADDIKGEISEESLNSIAKDNILVKTFKTVISKNNEIYLLYSDPNQMKLFDVKETDDVLAQRDFPSNKKYTDFSIPFHVVTLGSVHQPFFKQGDSALVVGEMFYLKDANNKVLALQQDQNSNRLHWKPDQQTMSNIKLTPRGECILSSCSRFYRCNPSESEFDPPLLKTDKEGEKDDQNIHNLKFPHRLQFNYACKSIICDVEKLKLLPDDDSQPGITEELKKEMEYGRSDVFEGVNLIFDAEKHVDTGMNLKHLSETTQKHGDHLKIWTNIEESPSEDFYIVHQNWVWLETVQENIRRYSFLGLFRKFCEADLYELMRLKKILREQKAIRKVEMVSLFADFHGSSVFSIFFREVKVLLRIIDQLERSEFPLEHDEDDNAIENSNLRRIYFVLSRHQMNKEPLYASVSSQTLESKESSVAESKWFQQSLIDLLKGDDNKDDPNQSKSNINCNSLLYRILYSDLSRNRDLILKIASYCDQFSLQTFILHQDDVSQLLKQPTMQIVQAFDDILEETQYTKQILTMDISAEQRLVTFWCKKFRLKQDECQNKTTIKLTQDMGIEKEDIMMNSVSVKMIELKWLQEGGKNFLDLVEIFNDATNNDIYPTRFVSSLLSGYWDIYKKKIFQTQFLPYICYMIGIHIFLMIALKDELNVLYMPLFGYCTIFIINQGKCEYIQWKYCQTNGEYFFDYWNMNDLIYLILNSIVLIVNILDLIDMYDQRTIAAISVCFLWFKVFDWLRLFDTTAFFISLIQQTIINIKAFLLILFICYMMFGSAFYILNMNRVNVTDVEYGDTVSAEIMPDISKFWVFDAFINQYELGLGEFELDGITASNNNKFLIYLLFILSTFMIQITFLNMLIAIMGDTFEKATEERDNNARLTKLRIMSDYINLIVRDSKNVSPPDILIAKIKNFFTETENVEIEEEKEFDILYVVQPDDQNNEGQVSWEGQLSALKRFTEKILGKTEAQLVKKVDKVLERVIEAEARDSTQEREQKTGLEHMMKSVEKKIEEQSKKQQDLHKEMIEQLFQKYLEVKIE